MLFLCLLKQEWCVQHKDAFQTQASLSISAQARDIILCALLLTMAVWCGNVIRLFSVAVQCSGAVQWCGAMV